MTIEADWTAAIQAAAQKLWGAEIDPALEPPEDIAHGDLTTSVAFKLAKQLKKAPKAIAAELAAALAAPGLARADVAGSGYLNLVASKEAAGALFSTISPAFGRSEIGKGVRVNVEFVSANPTGPLHIAHARQAAVGDAISNLLAWTGFDVAREFYVNDSGNQIRMLGESILARAEGRDLPENGYHGQYVADMAREFGAKPVDELARLGKQRLLAEIKAILERFRVRMDVWTSQEALEKGRAVDRLMGFYRDAGLSYEKDGAVWIKSQEHGDVKDEVLTKSDGTFAYRAPDLAYHRDKFDRGFDVVIDLLGPDHHAHAKTIRVGLTMLGLNLTTFREFMAAPPAKRPRVFEVVIPQHCRLLKAGEEVKFSKRAGTYVTLEDLLDEVGVDAARYLLTLRRADSHLDFDLDLAKKQAMDNPVFYAQYAHARIANIYRKGVETGLVGESDIDDAGVWNGAEDFALVGEPEMLLGRKIRTFPRVLQNAALNLDPSAIHPFIYELARLYQRYYDSTKVLCEDEPTRRMRLGVSAAVQQVLQNALGLYGVTAPHRM